MTLPRDCGNHGRGGSVTMAIKCKLDKEREHVSALLVLKIKRPTGTHKDETATTEEEEIGCWRIDEEQGQQKITDTEES